MKTVYSLSFALLFSTGTFGPMAMAASPGEAPSSCANLLTLIGRLTLPGTEDGSTHRSGLTVEASGNGSQWIASFFATLRPSAADRELRALAAADTRSRVLFLHRLSLAFTRTAPHLLTLMNGPQDVYPGQADDHLFRLLLVRSELVADRLLAPLLARTDLLPDYYDELLTIAADFATVPFAYGTSVALVDFLEPHANAHPHPEGRLGDAALYRVKFHALTNHLLENPNVAPGVIHDALDRVGTALRARHAEALVDWLVPQIGYWIDLGTTLQASDELFPRARWVVAQLIDELPWDLRGLEGAAAPIRHDVRQLLAALDAVPGLVAPAQVQRLRALVAVH